MLHAAYDDPALSFNNGAGSTKSYADNDLDLEGGKGESFQPRGLSVIRTDIEFDDFDLSGSFEEAEDERRATLGLLENTIIHRFTNRFIGGPPKLEKRYRRARLKENARLLRWVSGLLLLCFLLDCITQVYRWQNDKARVASYTLLCVILCFQLGLFLFRNRLYSHLLIHYYQYTTTILGVSAFMYVLVTDTMSSCVLFGCSIEQTTYTHDSEDIGDSSAVLLLLHSEDATRAAYGMSLLFAVLPFGFRMAFAYCAVMYACALSVHTLLRSLTLIMLGTSSVSFDSSSVSDLAPGSVVVSADAPSGTSFELIDSLLLDTLYLMTIMCVMLYGAYVYERNDREVFLRMEMQNLQKDQLQSELEMMREELGFAEDEANTNELKLEIERAKSDLDRIEPGAQLELEEWVMPFDVLAIDQRIGEGSCGEVYRGRVRPSREHQMSCNYGYGYNSQLLTPREGAPAACSTRYSQGNNVSNIAKSFRSTFSFRQNQNSSRALANGMRADKALSSPSCSSRGGSHFDSNGSCMSPLYMTNRSLASAADKGVVGSGGTGVSGRNRHSTNGHRREFSSVPYNSIVAIKRIPKHKVTRKVVLSLLQETLIMSKCRHPNVLRLVGLVYDPFVCVIFEYMALGSLKDILEASSPAAVARANGNFGVAAVTEQPQSLRAGLRSSKGSMSGKFQPVAASGAQDLLNSSINGNPAGHAGTAAPQQEDFFRDQDRSVKRQDMLRSLVDPTNPAKCVWTHAKTRMCVNVAAGLSYLHSQGIIHRDVKADNLMVDGTHAVKVADMGTARVLAEYGFAQTDAEHAREQHSAASATDADGLAQKDSKRKIDRRQSRLVRRPLSRVGSPLWIAPEVISSEGQYDEKCDVWSFGVVLCEIISHRDPYSDNTGRCHFNLLSVVDGELNPVDFVEDCADNIPDGILRLARNCCTFDPSKRPSMKQALFRLLQITVEQETSKVEAEAIAAAGPYLRYSQPSRRSVFRRHSSSLVFDSVADHEIFQAAVYAQQQFAKQDQLKKQGQQGAVGSQPGRVPVQGAIDNVDNLNIGQTVEEEEEARDQASGLSNKSNSSHSSGKASEGSKSAVLRHRTPSGGNIDVEIIVDSDVEGDASSSSDDESHLQPLASKRSSSRRKSQRQQNVNDLDSLGSDDDSEYSGGAVDKSSNPSPVTMGLFEAPPALLQDHQSELNKAAYMSSRRASARVGQRRSRPVSVRTDATYLTAFSNSTGEIYSPHGSQWESGLTVDSDIPCGFPSESTRRRMASADIACECYQPRSTQVLHRAFSTHALGETVDTDVAQSLLSSYPSMGSMLNVKENVFVAIRHLKAPASRAGENTGDVESAFKDVDQAELQKKDKRKLSASEIITKTLARVRSGTAQTFGPRSSSHQVMSHDDAVTDNNSSSNSLNVSFIAKGNF